MRVKIISASHHRNGVGGAGFYAILFKWAGQTMIASMFDEPGYCAVYCVSMLAAGNAEFGGGNSWRGDEFEAALRPALEEWPAAHESEAAHV